VKCISSVWRAVECMEKCYSCIRSRYIIRTHAWMCLAAIHGACNRACFCLVLSLAPPLLYRRVNIDLIATGMLVFMGNVLPFGDFLFLSQRLRKLWTLCFLICHRIFFSTYTDVFEERLQDYTAYTAFHSHCRENHKSQDSEHSERRYFLSHPCHYLCGHCKKALPFCEMWSRWYGKTFICFYIYSIPRESL
jgi:hypothetical protein